MFCFNCNQVIDNDSQIICDKCNYDDELMYLDKSYVLVLKLKGEDICDISPYVQYSEYKKGDEKNPKIIMIDFDKIEDIETCLNSLPKF